MSTRQKLFFAVIVCITLSANNAFAQYSNSTLNGPWFLYTAPLVPKIDSLDYLVFDGNGNITDGSMYGTVTGNYSVTVSGAFSGILKIGFSDSFPIGGQLISNNLATVGPMVLKRISNPGALTDSLIGVVTSGLSQCGSKNIVLQLNSNGQIISSSGLTSPVSGRVYADSGIFIGHIKTGDSSQCRLPNGDYAGSWDEFTILGTFSNDLLNGPMGIDGPQDSNRDSGTTHLVRKGTVTTGIVPIAASAPEFSTRPNCYPNPSLGKFTISLRNSVARDLHLQVFNVLGEIKYQERINNIVNNYSKQIDLSKFSKGVYFVKIHNGEKIHTEKIVIQ